jgi:hypothetical protein
MSDKGWDANDLLEMIALGRRWARRSGKPQHIIAQAGKLRLVDTLTAIDDVIVRDIIAPRRTDAMISASVQAQEEISQARPFIQRAAHLIADASDRKDVCGEILADMMESELRYLQRLDDENYLYRPESATPRRPLWARIFGTSPVSGG